MISGMDETGRPLNSEDIQHLECAVGVRLPLEYRNFLLRYNGGRPIPCAFPIEGMELNPYGVIQIFFGIEHEIESSNLEWNYHTFDGRIPSNLLPIACDDGGDLICLSLFGSDAGSIVFWDYYAESADPSYDNVYHIADSFEEFLENIQKLPEG